MTMHKRATVEDGSKWKCPRCGGSGHVDYGNSYCPSFPCPSCNTWGKRERNRIDSMIDPEFELGEERLRAIQDWLALQNSKKRKGKTK